MQMKSESQ